MKKPSLIAMLICIAVVSFGQKLNVPLANLKSYLNLEFKGSSNDISINPCEHPEIFKDSPSHAFTATGTSSGPIGGSQKYDWFRNDEKTPEFSDANMSIQSALPGNLVKAGKWKVILTVSDKNGKTIETRTSNTLTVTFVGQAGSYEMPRIAGSIVSGDFDHDGIENDIAGFYDYTNNQTALHVWRGDNMSLNYQGDQGWWSSSTFNSSKIQGRTVSGDFDRNGIKDDIAAFYDYGNSHTEVHVWHSTGTNFNYLGSWWKTGFGNDGFDANRISYRVVAGDFDRDGYYDDITMFYQYDNFQTAAFVLSSAGNKFLNSGQWYNSGPGNFDAMKITGKIVSGDFNNDGFEDDITAFYNYSSFRTVAFVWNSLGSSFSGPKSWYDSGVNQYDAYKITFTVVSGDFDNDGFKDDITTLYKGIYQPDGSGGELYNNNVMRAYVFTSTGTEFFPVVRSWYHNYSFNTRNVWNSVVTGDYDNDGKVDDVSMFYDYNPGFSVRNFIMRSNSLAFEELKEAWTVCNNLDDGKLQTNNQSDLNQNLIEELESNSGSIPGMQKDISISLFPNPNNGQFTLLIPEDVEFSIEIINPFGQVIYTSQNIYGKIEIDLDSQLRGIYLLKASNNSGTLKSLKFLLQ